MSDRNQHDAGKNMGQGLPGVNDNQRRDLMNQGGDRRTQDQRHVRSSDAKGGVRQGNDDASSAPESGSP
ncbi:MAG: hypothetical protein ACOY37_02935 [Pseudomonadota bacterium]